MRTWGVCWSEMNQRTAPLAVLIITAVAVVAVPAAGVAPGAIGGQGVADDVTPEETSGTNAVAANESGNASVAPGARLTGIIGVQKAEIDGEVQSRSFEIALNRSDDNASKAATIAGQVTDLEDRLAALRENRSRLDQARENGTISEGEYRARIAEVGARIATMQRLANQTENATRTIPEETLRENGVNVSAIQRLRDDARNLSGQEVAAIARSIAGPGAGKGLGRGPPANKTPGDSAPGNGQNGPGNGQDGPGNGQAGPGNGQDGGQAESPGSNVSDGPPDGVNAPGNDAPAGNRSGNDARPGAPGGGNEADGDGASDSGGGSASVQGRVAGTVWIVSR